MVDPFTDGEVELLRAFAIQASYALISARHFDEAERRNARLADALQLQTATSEVLGLISANPGDLTTVLEGILAKAAELCDSDAGMITSGYGGRLKFVAGHGASVRPYVGMNLPPGNQLPAGIVVSPYGANTTDDFGRIAADVPFLAEMARSMGIGSYANALLTVDGRYLGGIHIFRHDIRPFSDAALSRLASFAEQASLAIANARLFTDLEESLALQTATADILRLITDNPGDPTPVIQAALDHAIRLTGATGGVAVEVDAGQGRVVASAPDREGPFVGRSFRIEESRTWSTITEVEGVRLFDDFPQALRDRGAGRPALDEVAAIGIQKMLIAPMFRSGQLVGGFQLGRLNDDAFDERDAAVARTFTDQVAIAMANARLFNDLDAALERQTAMTEVLDAVSTSRFDLQPVFDVLAHHANRLCGGTGAGVGILEGDVIVVRSASGGLGGATLLEWPLDDDSMVGASALHREVIHVRNWDDEPAGRYPRSGSRIADRKSALTIPLVRNDTLVGVVAFSRPDAGGYSDNESSLLQTFANQAAIAVDNARLLQEIEQRNTELAESLELQTATSEVLTLISSNPGDLGDHARSASSTRQWHCAMPTSARQCSATTTCCESTRARTSPSSAESSELTWGCRGTGARPPSTGAARRRGVAAFDSMRAWMGPKIGSSGLELNRVLGAKSFATVPLIQNDTWIGNLNLIRRTIRPFDPDLTAVLQAFADQAAIAIANARLFNDLDRALERQTAMTDVLDAVSVARLDLQPVFDKVAEHADRLCAGTGAMVLRPRRQRSRVRRDRWSVAVRGRFDRTPRADRRALAHRCRHRSSAVVHVRDWDSTGADEYPDSLARSRSHKSALAVPMLRTGEAVGVVAFARAQPGGYRDDEISLLQTFANQAAIAVDNARLLQEIERRTPSSPNRWNCRRRHRTCCS